MVDKNYRGYDTYKLVSTLGVHHPYLEQTIIAE